MSNADHSNAVNRRDFLKLGTLGTALGLTPAVYAADAPAPADSPSNQRVLGRTGLKIAVVSLGAMRTTEPKVMQATFDRGVNYVDTARVYMDGENEKHVGVALKGYRDKVLLATKTEPGSKDDIFKSTEASLQALQTDYIDVHQLHAFSSKDEVMNAEMREAMAELKKQGKIRWIGLTTHKNEAEVLNAMADDPDHFFDMVLVKYNFQSPPEVKEAVARAAKAGIGIVAMKTQAGGYNDANMGGISPHQAALKWVLQDPNVTTTIPSMVDLAQVKENMEVMGMQFAQVDRQILDRYAKVIEPYYCRMCGECEPSCPFGVDISSVNRCLMYAEGYGDATLARWSYGRLAPMKTAAVCGDCSVCVAQCPNGLNIAEKMQRARTVLA